MEQFGRRVGCVAKQPEKDINDPSKNQEGAKLKTETPAPIFRNNSKFAPIVWELI